MRISVCSVILDGMENYTQVFLHSLQRHCANLKEVIFVKVDGIEEGLFYQQEIQGIPCKFIGFPFAKDYNEETQTYILSICGHALGLHHAIDHATADYIWLTDPDIFFFSPVDSLYLDLMQRFDLNIIGVAHFNRSNQAYLDFPCVTNCLVKREALPQPDWLQGSLFLRSVMRKGEFTNQEKLVQMDGKYLIPGPIGNLSDTFPNPAGYFDAGCNLWLWNNDRRWLSFTLNQPHPDIGYLDLVYPMNYSTATYTTNFGLTEDLGQTDLLYHRTRGGRDAKNQGVKFRELYDDVSRAGENRTHST